MVKRKSTPKRKSHELTPSRHSQEPTMLSRKLQAGTSSNTTMQNSSKSRRKSPPKKRKPGKIELRVGKMNFKMFRTTLKEIIRLQKTTSTLIPKLPFSRVIREILMDYSHTDLRIQSEALRAIQESAEYFLTYLFEDANKCAMHARRVTLKVPDMKLALELRGIQNGKM